MKKVKSIYKSKLIELQILKSRIYKKNNIRNRTSNLKQTQIYIKKIAHIIYEFHAINKRILFLNFPKKLEKKITWNLKDNQHIFTSNENFLNGIISNQKVNFQKSNKLQKFIKTNSKTKIPIKKLIDLIVIFNPISEINSDKKLYMSQIPTITITESSNNNLYLKQNYKLIGHFKFIEKQINNNLFFSILKSILKSTCLKKNKHVFKK